MCDDSPEERETAGARDGVTPSQILSRRPRLNWKGRHDMAIVRFRQDPWRALEDLHDELSGFLAIPSHAAFPMFGRRTTLPTVDVSEDGGNVYVDAEVPGMEKKDIDVSLLDGNLLAISAKKEKKEETKKRNYYRTESYYGEYYREIELPKAVDAAGIKARVHDGILSITLPKKTAEKELQTKIHVE
jgi:HSP20 family protein